MNKKQINDYIDNYKEEMVLKLAEFVSIPSIYDEHTSDDKNPFGNGVTQALQYFYNLAKSDGFEVTNYDNYCVEVVYGKGPIIDILAHCDVVEVSDNWKFNPFDKLYDSDYVYGRGTQDDKGPLLASYYALKAIKELNLPINKKIRFIVGGNEESGSKCLEYYYNTLKKEYPSCGFTPDAEFPIIHGEKGITRIEVIYDKIDSGIIDIFGGKALNIVMDEVVFKTKNGDKKYLGKAAHASKPEAGINAFVLALKDLKKDYKCFEKLYNDFSDYNGNGLCINSCDNKLKDLTMNIGKVRLEDRKLHIILDIRYPLSINVNEIKKRIEEKGYMVKILMDEAPIYMDENSNFVETLLESYKEITNLDDKPYTIGGGTYAKSSKNVVAFGMLFKDDEDLMHQDNERIRIDHYLLGAKIYFNALIKLIK